MEAEHPILMDQLYRGDYYDDNDNKDIATGDSGGTLDADCDDVDNDNDNDSDRNNNYEEQEESDATQQYPKRTREQVVNDKYILEQQQQQQKAALHQEMEVERRVDKEMQIQEVVDKDTVVVCSSANNDGDHVIEKKRQEIERDNNDNKIRNRMESSTHGILLVTEENGGWSVTQNKAKYNRNDKVQMKEYRRIIHREKVE